MSHLRIFRSVAIVQISNEKRDKLHDKSKKLIFVAYDQRSKGYTLNNPRENIVIRRDVVFDEEGKWEFRTHKKEYNFFP